MRQAKTASAFLLTALMFSAFYPFVCHAQSRERLVQSPDLHIPVDPTPVRIAGKRHLAYELHITNFRPAEIVLTRLEVLDADRQNRLAVFTDTDLVNRLGRPGAPADLKDKRVIGGGTFAVVFLWLPLEDETTTPSRIQHRIEYDLIRPSGNEHIAVETAASNVLNESPVVLDPPLRGGPWVALYDPRLERGHRTSIYTINGRARIPARYAIDWIKLDDKAQRARGDESTVSNWHGYGAEVLAVADGVVSEARDDIAEDAAIAAATGAISLENASGNYIALDLGGGRFAFYEHLKHGSLKVRKGDRVKSGQVIAFLGNSGSSSSGPHLHFHVSDANAALAAEGRPYVFRSFEVIGAFPSMNAFASRQRWEPVPRDKMGQRTMELPDASTVVLFKGK